MFLRVGVALVAIVEGAVLVGYVSNPTLCWVLGVWPWIALVVFGVVLTTDLKGEVFLPIVIACLLVAVVWALCFPTTAAIVHAINIGLLTTVAFSSDTRRKGQTLSIG